MPATIVAVETLPTGRVTFTLTLQNPQPEYISVAIFLDADEHTHPVSNIPFDMLESHVENLRKRNHLYSITWFNRDCVHRRLKAFPGSKVASIYPWTFGSPVDLLIVPTAETPEILHQAMADILMDADLPILLNDQCRPDLFPNEQSVCTDGPAIVLPAPILRSAQAHTPAVLSEEFDIRMIILIPGDDPADLAPQAHRLASRARRALLTTKNLTLGRLGVNSAHWIWTQPTAIEEEQGLMALELRTTITINSSTAQGPFGQP